MAMERFLAEFDRVDTKATYDELYDADKLQLENPKGRERWEMIVYHGDREMELRQLFYSDAGSTWQMAASFCFDIEVLMEPLLESDTYYNGLLEAISGWPVAKWYVTPIEDEYPN